MRVLNVRLGFATNSSSSHSIIVLPEHVPLPIGLVDDPDGYTFDEEDFLLVSAEDKSRYLTAQVAMALEASGLPNGIAQTLSAGWFGRAASYTGAYMSVDCQSVLQFPHLTQMPAEFLRDVQAAVLHPRVVIVGGSDNSSGPPLATGRRILDLPRSCLQPMDARMRKDAGVWTIFNRGTGHKLRLQTDPTRLDLPYLRSPFPELVDVKITDWCPFGCSFCYQASTTAGVHAQASVLRDVFAQLSALDVFEVALGGGEPTMHPEFVQILTDARAQGLVPNFTTYATKWLKSPEVLEAVVRLVGGIGVSVHTVADLKRARMIATAILMERERQRQERLDQKHADQEYVDWDADSTPNVLVQHVLGSLSVYDTVALIHGCADQGLPLLLLGYKDTGFGSGHSRTDMTTPEAIAALVTAITSTYIRLSVDTSVCLLHPDLVAQVRTAACLQTSAEGAFSFYIDGVARTMGASSYVDPTQMQPLPPTADGILDVYRGYGDAVVAEMQAAGTSIGTVSGFSTPGPYDGDDR